MQVIVHNDDIGLSYGFTQAIQDCHSSGLTTSTSIRTNGTAYRYCVKKVLPNLKNLGLGIHLNLTDGPTKTAGLANREGHYKRGFLGYCLSLLWSNKTLIQEIEKDLRSQFEQALVKDKLSIDHVNSHGHIHMIPQIFGTVARLTREYEIRYLRLSKENYYLMGDFSQDLSPFFNTNLARFLALKSFSQVNRPLLRKYGLKTADCFYGILHTGRMGEVAIKGAMLDGLKHGYSLIEILAHPVYTNSLDKSFTSEFIKRYSRKKERLLEAEALKSKSLKEFVKRQKIILTNYKELSQE